LQRIILNSGFQKGWESLDPGPV